MRRWASVPDQGLHAACGTVSNALAFRYQFLALSDGRAGGEPGGQTPGFRRAANASAWASSWAWTGRRLLPRCGPMTAGSAGWRRRWLKAASGWPATPTRSPMLRSRRMSLRLDHLNLSWMWDRRAALAAWYDAVQARPNFAGLADYIEPSYLEIMDAHAAELRAQGRGGAGGVAGSGAPQAFDRRCSG